MLIGGFTPAVGKVYSFCKNSRILIQKHQYFYRNSFPVIFGETASNKTFTESAKDCREVSIEINGCSGASKGDEIPVNSLISPRRALAYKPLTSRRSHSSMGVLTYTSRKSSSPIISEAIRRIAWVGLIKAAMVTIPQSTNNLETSAMRRIFSVRSASEKPRLLLMPLRILSPSRIRQSIPCLYNSPSRAMANVLLPDHNAFLFQ